MVPLVASIFGSVFSGFGSVFTAFVDLMYEILRVFEAFVRPVFGSQSSWIAIVLLTAAVRLILIPLTVKQVRAARSMATIQPELQKLQAKYKGDRTKLSEETMRLYQERGVNPFMGCLPLLVQMPFFYALVRAFDETSIMGHPNFLATNGFFGVPLETHWLALSGWGARLGSLAGIVTLVMVFAVMVTSYISQRQVMGRQAASGAGGAASQQQMMKYMPIIFGVMSINFPLAVMIYWTTTNLWSMGQQGWLLRRPIKDAPSKVSTVPGAQVKTGKFVGWMQRAQEEAEQRRTAAAKRDAQTPAQRVPSSSKAVSDAPRAGSERRKAAGGGRTAGPSNASRSQSGRRPGKGRR